MTNFATHVLLGSPVASLAGKDKGDVSNRAKCAGSQLVNNAKNVGVDVLVIGGTALTAKKILTNKNFAQKIANTVSKCINVLSKNFRNSYAGQKLITKIKSAPGMYGKALAAVAAVGLSAFALVNSKYNFKRGQIDQKYTDKAKIENQTKDMI